MKKYSCKKIFKNPWQIPEVQISNRIWLMMVYFFLISVFQISLFSVNFDLLWLYSCFLIWQLSRAFLNKCNFIKPSNRSCSCPVVSGCLQKHISKVVSYIRQERILHMPICRQLLKDISASQDHACLTCIALALNVNKSKLGPAHHLIQLGHV